KCAPCARLLATDQRYRQEVRAYDWVRPTPVHVRRQVLAALDAEAAAEQPRWWQAWWRQPVYRLALSGGLVALALAVAVTLPQRGERPAAALRAVVVSDFHAVEANQLAVAFRTDDPRELRDYFQRTANLGFSNTVANLEVLGWELVGGSIVDLAGKP